MVRKNSLAPGHSLSWEVELVISSLFTRQHVLLILYWFFERALSVFSTALKKNAIFSVLNVFLCFNAVANVTRDVVPQLFSEKCIFTIIVASMKVIEHYTYFFSLFFCLNYAVFKTGHS